MPRKSSPILRKIETEEQFVARIERTRKTFTQRDSRKRWIAKKIRPYQDWCMYGGKMPPRPKEWRYVMKAEADAWYAA